MSIETKSFRLVYRVSRTLTAEQVWPGGDGPANPTAADVERAILAAGGWARVLLDWNLLDEKDYRSVEER